MSRDRHDRDEAGPCGEAGGQVDENRPRRSPKQEKAEAETAFLGSWSMFGRPVAEWIRRYPYLEQYSFKQLKKKIIKLSAAEMVLDRGLRELETTVHDAAPRL